MLQQDVYRLMKCSAPRVRLLHSRQHQHGAHLLVQQVRWPGVEDLVLACAPAEGASEVTLLHVPTILSCQPNKCARCSVRTPILHACIHTQTHMGQHGCMHVIQDRCAPARACIAAQAGERSHSNAHTGKRETVHNKHQHTGVQGNTSRAPHI